MWLKLHTAQLTTETIPTLWAVTHSWTSDMDSNQSISIACSTSFVRSELLGLRAEYVWLDVVCLLEQSEIDSIKGE